MLILSSGPGSAHVDPLDYSCECLCRKQTWAVALCISNSSFLVPTVDVWAKQTLRTFIISISFYFPAHERLDKSRDLGRVA